MIPVEKLKPLYDFLNNIDVCKRCILRFLEVSLLDIFFYKNPECFEEKYALLASKEENVAKRTKRNVCPVCLNILSDECLDNVVSKLSKAKSDEYTSREFHIALSFPRACLIRFHSICLHLKENFPDFNSSDVLQLQKLVKNLISEKIERQTGKKSSNSSKLELSIEYGYEDDHHEVANVINLDKSKFTQKKDKFRQQTSISRHMIQTILEKCNKKLFRDNFPVPPVTPTGEAHFLKDEWSSDALFLGGRYLKFGRNISQSPWVVEGQLLAPLSVTDIVFDAVCKYLRYEKSQMTFTASGREDADVRMLGNGRPFYIKIDNPKGREISRETFEAIEREIIKDGLVAVKSLQTIKLQDIAQIKAGEDSKTKIYRALCQTYAPNVDEVIKNINAMMHSELVITQKTPLRVVHRRALAPRLKKIYRMFAEKVEGHDDLFEVEMETQAGTYVKEFVNGDLGRTVPNLTSLIGYSTDIVALDVKDIVMTWPLENNETV